MPSFAMTAAAIALLQSAGADIARAEQDRLDACLETLETDPEAAYEDGLAWTYEGNRPGARYCTARALMALGQIEEGALRLERLANASDAGDAATRTSYLAQAGNGWLTARRPDAAIVALTNALKLQPGDTGITKDRAVAYLLNEEWTKAVTDLDSVLASQPGDAEAFQLRAKAKYQQENFDQALADIRQSMAIDPTNIDTLVLRGEIREKIRVSQ